MRGFRAITLAAATLTAATALAGLTAAAAAPLTPTTITLGVSPADRSPSDAPITITATVKTGDGAAVSDGSVAFTLSGGKLPFATIPLSAGTATVVPTYWNASGEGAPDASDLMPTGQYTITARYAGTGALAPSSTSTPYLVYPSDVSASNPFLKEIAWSVSHGYQVADNGTSYGARVTVDRGEAATVLYHYAQELNLASASIPCGRQVFWDVKCITPVTRGTNVRQGPAVILYLAGLVDGYHDKGHVLPGWHGSANLSRQAIASVLFRFANFNDYLNSGAKGPLCIGGPMRDVSSESPFCSAIKWMVDDKITTGYADGTFRPTAGLDRETLAVFLYRMTHQGA